MKTFRSFLSNKRSKIPRKKKLTRTFPRIELTTRHTLRDTHKQFSLRNHHQKRGGTRKKNYTNNTLITDFTTEEDKQIINNQTHVFDETH